MQRLFLRDSQGWFRLLVGNLIGSAVGTDSQRGTGFRDLPRPARLWLIFIGVVYIVVAALAAPHARPIVLVVLIPVFALAGLVKPTPHPSGGIQDAVGTVIAIAALIWTPPEVVLGVGIGSCLGGRLFRRTGWWRTDINAASWGISAGIAATLAQSLMHGVSQGTFRLVMGASVAILVHFVTNRLTFAGVRSHRFRRPFLHELRQGLSFGWLHELLSLPVIVAVVGAAYAMGDLAWSLAITTAAMLLLPLDQWVDRRYLDFAMQRRASAFLTESQVTTSAGGRLPGRVAARPEGQRSLWAAVWRSFEGRRGSSESCRQGQSETRFGALMEHIPEGISLINAEGTIVYANSTACRVLGYGKSEQVGRSWFEICHPDDVGRAKSLFSSLVREPGSHCTVEARMLHRDGSWKWIHASQVNLFVEPSVRAIVVTYRDVTQGRRAEETLEEYAARLEDLSRRLVQAQETERRRIAQELHDETGQIITGLKLTLDVALSQIGEGEGRATLSRVAAMVETLQKQLRTLSLNLRPAALDDLGLLPAVLMLCRQYETDMSVRVKTIHNGISGRRFAPEVETTAYRVVQEGLTNIARHAAVHEAIVRLWTDGEVLSIQVEDSGKGFVVESAEFTGRPGGLSGMRERVLLVGGEFVVEPKPGKGTRVTAELPLGHPAAVALAAKAQRICESDLT